MHASFSLSLLSLSLFLYSIYAFADHIWTKQKLKYIQSIQSVS